MRNWLIAVCVCAASFPSLGIAQSNSALVGTWKLVSVSSRTEKGSDGKTPETVPWTGLRATTRAYAMIIDEVNKMDLSDLQRPEEK